MIPVEVKRIIEAVENDRRKKVSEIKKAGNLEVKKKMKEAGVESEKLRKNILGDYEKRAEVLKRKGFADIEIKKRESLKDVKAEMVKILKEEVLNRMKKDKYEKFLVGFIERGVKEIGKENLEVFVNKDDVGIAKKFLRRNGLKGRVKTIKTHGGCMIKSGKMTANYLTESVMEREGREIDKIINEMFFKG